MQIRNPYVGTEPVRCLAITTSGTKYSMSMMAKPIFDIADDISELIVEWPWQGRTQSKVWTQEKGWLEVEEYNERKRFAEERARFAEEQAKARKRRTQRDEPQLDLKVTPHEDDSPTSD